MDMDRSIDGWVRWEEEMLRKMCELLLPLSPSLMGICSMHAGTESDSVSVSACPSLTHSLAYTTAHTGPTSIFSLSVRRPQVAAAAVVHPVNDPAAEAAGMHLAGGRMTDAERPVNSIDKRTSERGRPE